MAETKLSNNAVSNAPITNSINVADNLEFLGRILEIEDLHVWGASAVEDDDGKIHLYFSAWPKSAPHAAWVISCKIYHAVADSIEGPYTVLGEAVGGRDGKAWDSWSIHNPNVVKVDGKYVMTYMGSTGDHLEYDSQTLSSHIQSLWEQGRFKLPEAVGESRTPEDNFSAKIWDCYMKLVESKRVGMAISDTPYGPWRRVTSTSTPTIDVGLRDEWDSVVTSNPALIKGLDNKYYLYYKSWDFESWETRHGNRKYGVAVADSLEGPYIKHPSNPILDFEHLGNNAQIEDACVFIYQNKYHMIARDMGIQDHYRGVYLYSDDGLNWSNPTTAYQKLSYYSNEKPLGIEQREDRFERPQVLLKDNKPYALFCAAIGGKYATSTNSVFKINL